MPHQAKEKSRIKLLALWLVLAGAAVGLIAYFSTGPIATAVQNSRKTTPVGALKISLYNDANQDGAQDLLDPAEHLIAGVDVLIGNDNYRAEKTSNDQGQVFFEDVPAGQYDVSLNYNNASITDQELTTKIEEDRAQNTKIGVIAKESINISFIVGTVTLDTNNNGELDKTDEPLSSKVLQLWQGDNKILEVSSGLGGEYTVPARLPGEYTLIIPKQEKIPRALSKQVKIRSNLDPKKIDFLITIK